MLRSLKELRGYSIFATDDRIGSAEDFFFDDRDWIVRYLVVDTGKWLPGRLILVSPMSLETADHTTRKLGAALTQQQIEDSPGVEKHRPVSRQMEHKLAAYYAWPVYWGSHAGAIHPPVGAVATPTAVASSPEGEVRDVDDAGVEDNRSLRSVREVTGYHVQALDDGVGHVEDFIVDDEAWIIRYLVVDTRNWLPGRKVLVSPRWFNAISWDDHKVFADLSKEAIKKSPEYDPHEPINIEYEKRLYDYYGRPYHA